MAAAGCVARAAAFALSQLSCQGSVEAQEPGAVEGVWLAGAREDVEGSEARAGGFEILAANPGGLPTAVWLVGPEMDRTDSVPGVFPHPPIPRCPT
ncbi:unnamed protein product, partial [Prorocentrum cordatum]